MVTTLVDVRSVLDVKRATMASQLKSDPETTSVFSGLDHFADVYGYQWYIGTDLGGPSMTLRAEISAAQAGDAAPDGSSFGSCSGRYRFTSHSRCCSR